MYILATDFYSTTPPKMLLLTSLVIGTHKHQTDNIYSYTKINIYQNVYAEVHSVTFETYVPLSVRAGGAEL